MKPTGKCENLMSFYMFDFFIQMKKDRAHTLLFHKFENMQCPRCDKENHTLLYFVLRIMHMAAILYKLKSCLTYIFYEETEHQNKRFLFDILPQNVCY